MSVGMGESWQAKGWKELYVAALLEGDRAKIPELISEAERAIVLRARGLFNAAGDNIEEEDGLDDALYALRALRSCLDTRNSLAEAA